MSVADKKSGKDSGGLVGKQLGDYTLTGKLTSGGMSHIYLGTDNRLGRQVAVKVLTPELMESDESLTARFKREARAVAALEHDNIIMIYQYGEQDGLYFLAMKYVAGMNLADELNRLRRSGQKMDIKRALRILEQIAAALDFAHAAGVIHRDIKPSNILLDQNDKAILTDFGLVLNPAVDQTLGTAFGTPRYISPEQAIASEDAKPQSDIYSLAVILFEILTGQSLFKGVTPMEMALSHINEPPPSPRSVSPDIPPAVDAEVLKALSKEPTQRHETALEFIHAVKKSYGLSFEVEELPTKPVPPPSTTPPPPSKAPAQAPPSPSAPTPAPVKTMMLEEMEASGKRAVEKIARKPKGRRRRWPLYLAVFWLVVVSTGGYMILNTDFGRNNVQAWFNSLTGRSGGELGSGLPVVLNYDYDTFAFRNPNSAALSLDSLRFVRGEAGGVDDFEGGSVRDRSLPPGKCVLISQQDHEIVIPQQWNCGVSALHQQAARFGPEMFWRVDGLINTFEVRLNDRVIQTCTAVGRDQVSQCEIEWAAIASG